MSEDKNKLTERVNRSKHIDIRLTPGEYESIIDKAQSCNLTASVYARKVLMGARPRHRLTNREVEILSTLGDASGDLVRVRNILKNKSDAERRELFGSVDYMKKWIDYINTFIERWKEVSQSLTRN